MMWFTESPVPIAEGAIERQRLLQRMQGSSHYKVCIISAPPGYGKTTLVSQFAHKSPDPVVWHTLDVTQGDVINLHERSLDAFSSIVPDILSTRVLHRPEPEELATSLTNFLRQHLPNRIYYILDDVHHLVGSLPAETWLRTLVRRLPAKCRIVLLSRTLPRLPLTEMIGRQQLLAMGAEDLRFTDEEINELWNTAQNVSLYDRKQLLEQLEGWPAGVSLALRPLPHELDLLSLGNDVGPDALFKSLATLLLESQPSDVRTFLLDSSTLSKLTPELCVRVLNLPNAAHQLNELLRRNLFLTRVSGGLTYHGLFRSFLQNQLKTQQPDRFVQLHEKAAVWFENDNQDEQALDHYLTAEMPHKAALIADKRAKLYFAQGKFHSLLKWDHALGHKEVSAPNLWYHCAIVSIHQYQYDVAESGLLLAEACFEQTNNQSGLANVQLQRAYSLLNQGRYHEALSIAQPLIQELHDLAGERGTMLYITGIAHLHLGETALAVRDLEAALPLYRQHNDAHALTALLQSLDVAYVRSHRLDDAAHCIQEVVHIRRQLRGQSALALALNNLGYHHHLRGDYFQAKSTFDEALDILSRDHDRRTEAYLMWSMGDLVRDRGGFNEAYHLYRRSLDIVGDGEPVLECGVLASLSTLYRWQGRFQESQMYAQNALQIAQDRSIKAEILRASAALCAARAALGETQNAVTQLDSIVDQLHQTQAHVQHIWVLSLCITISIQNRDMSRAADYLRSIFEIIHDDGCVQPLAAEVVHNAPLRSFVGRYETRYPLIGQAIKNLEEAKLTSEFTPDLDSHHAPVYSLRVYTLGQHRVERDGEPVRSSDWQTTKARDLFFLLLLKGPRTRESVGIDLWPDGSQAQINSNFHITLHRARQAVGQQVILFSDGLYLINSDVSIWCDAFEFEDMVRQARLCSPNSPQAEEMWERAANIYHGDFLESVDVDWVQSRREALREEYIGVLTNLGGCAFTRGDYGYALSVFQQASEVDPYREDVHQSILRCFSKLDRRDKIASHHAEFERLLQRDLAVSPSLETIQLALNLIG